MALTKQQIADGIYDWFFAKGNRQSKKSPSSSFCMYRNPQGAKCAVGCLIPDEMYNPQMENTGTVYEIFPEYPSLQYYFGKENLMFLSSCQRWHDSYFTDKDYLKEIFVKNKVDVTNMPLLQTQQE
jgi:hypothetical protein